MVILAALLGVLLGTAINALADTLPVTRRPGLPRCAHCGGPRQPAAGSGLLAFALGRRSCRFCGREMGLRPPTVEALGAAAAVLIYLRDPSPAEFWPAIAVAAIYALIVVIDIEHRLILHVVSLPAALLLGLVGSLNPDRGVIRTLLGGAAGFGILLALFLLGGLFAQGMARLRGRKLDEIALGFGDVTLSAVIGLTLGWPAVVAALLLGVFAAGLFSSAYLLIMMARRRYVAFTPIPYGPFLILGALLVYFGAGPRLLALAPG
jgi:prepilin signal peptidase PulO-like enzyme (type II secretory pathway)